MLSLQADLQHREGIVAAVAHVAFVDLLSADAGQCHQLTGHLS